MAPITVSLYTKNLIFDYATKYYYEHSKAPEAKTFELSDTDYEGFLSWLSDKDYDYVTEVEQTIDDLTEIAKDEKYFEEIKEQITSLRDQVQHNKEQDLKKFKSEIIEALEEEIAARYHLSDGKIEASFDDDAVLQSAISVLNDEAQYNNLLQEQE